MGIVIRARTHKVKRFFHFFFIFSSHKNLEFTLFFAHPRVCSRLFGRKNAMKVCKTL